MSNTPNPAQAFAAHLIARLASYGSEFWLAPGARSQSLAIAAAQLASRGQTKLRVRVDERSLGFSALGASVSGKPQVLITTSGTAVANLHPAVLEAHHSGIPLILLTADRPEELRGVGSNQTTNQVGIFSDAVIECIDVEAPKDGDDFEVIAMQLVERAITKAFDSRQPIQLNLQFREPLSDTTPDAAEIFESIEQKTLSVREVLAEEVELSKHAVVIAGANSAEFAEEISNLGLPVFAEPSSGVRHLASSILGYRFKLAESHELVSKIDQLVVYGKPTLSRPVIALLRSGIEVIVRPSRMGNFEIPRERKVISKAIINNSDPSWLASWLAVDELPKPSNRVDRQNIIQLAWESGAVDYLVLGASQMIREADYFAPRTNIQVWSNRGLAGIDGTVATATGIALNAGKVRAILGDLTFLHDVGSLVVDPADGELDLQLIVVNDNGGKIFEYLEVAKSVDRAIYDRVFRTGQNFKIADLAKGFGWQYVLVETLDDYRAALALSGRVIIEIQLD